VRPGLGQSFDKAQWTKAPGFEQFDCGGGGLLTLAPGAS